MEKESVMKEMMRLFGSFMSFDIPLRYELLSSQFLSAHEIYQKQFPRWNFAGTRKRLVADFGFRKVLPHFAAIFISALAVALPFSGNLNPVLLPAAAAALICFSIFTVFNYWPFYFTEFLPRLDSIIDETEKKYSRS